MISDPIRLLDQYLKDDLHCHIDLIRGDNPASFTRKRIISIQDPLLQMLTRKNKTQFSEVMAYYDSMNKSMPVTEKAFFMARKKFNPEAVRVMSNEFIAKVYDDYDDSIKKWKDLVILGIDGSKCTVPNTDENRLFFGTHDNGSGTAPAMALISTLHDSINNLKLDVQADRINGCEKDLALRHINEYCDNYHQKALFVFDRGYVSIRIMDRITERSQYFLLRSTNNAYTKYFDQVGIGEDKELEVTFDRASTNKYRNDRSFRIHLLNTTYRFRFAKIVIGTDEAGNETVEYLITNLPKDIVSTDELKDAYWLRWGIETSYNRLKNRMGMEEFSGHSPDLILQDIYADTWMYNLVSLKIMEANETEPLEQKDGEYTVSRNFNKSVGVLKTYLLKSLMSEDESERTRLLERIDNTIASSLNWVKTGNRSFERKSSLNKSAMTYRKTY